MITFGVILIFCTALIALFECFGEEGTGSAGACFLSCCIAACCVLFVPGAQSLAPLLKFGVLAGMIIGFLGLFGDKTKMSDMAATIAGIVTFLGF